jgi:biotin synthase
MNGFLLLREYIPLCLNGRHILLIGWTMKEIRTDWTGAEVEQLYRSALFTLLGEARKIHNQFHDPLEMQVCTLISIKTGGCPEDCKYCAQSSRYQTSVKAEALLSLEQVKGLARKAQERGATRVCLGAAWKKVRDGAAFDAVLHMVSELNASGVEVCCTLGTLTQEQALKLKRAGLYAYNHNIDTSRDFYPQVITTRTFDERLETLEKVRSARLSVCCGGIVGLGESEEDRISFLHTLCTQVAHPDSVPINILHRVEGTPLAEQAPLDFWEVLRTIATARVLMPQAMVRLSAGRVGLTREQQALCFLAGANSLWLGETLLTVANPSIDADEEMFKLFGLKKKVIHARTENSA